MLVQQTTPIPQSVQYFLDGACECHELLGCHLIALTLFGDRQRMADIVAGTVHRLTPAEAVARAEAIDAGQSPRRNWRGDRQSIALALADEAMSIIRQCDEDEQRSYAALAYGHFRVIVRDHAEFFASWRYEDLTTGGAAKPFLKRWRLDRTMQPTPALAGHLASAKAIRRYVKRDSECAHVRALYETIAGLPLPSDLSAGERLIAALNKRLQEQRVQLFRDIELKRPQPNTRLVRQAIAAQRKVTKRAAVMAAALLGASTVSAFARGEPVIIPGRDIAFRIVAAGRMDQIGHGALRVDLQSLEGQRLSGLCVYFEGTPALDQLTAIALHAAAGEEAAVIKTGNLYAIDAAAAGHPALAERAKPKPSGFSDRQHITRDRERQLIELGKNQHFQRCGAIYREAAAVAICGRRAALVLEAA